LHYLQVIIDIILKKLIIKTYLSKNQNYYSSNLDLVFLGGLLEVSIVIPCSAAFLTRNGETI